jgi:hypothetical protein
LEKFSEKSSLPKIPSLPRTPKRSGRFFDFGKFRQKAKSKLFETFMGFYLAFRLKYARFAINKTKKKPQKYTLCGVSYGKKKNQRKLKKN